MSHPVGSSPWGPVVACTCGRVAPEGLPVPHAPGCATRDDEHMCHGCGQVFGSRAEVVEGHDCILGSNYPTNEELISYEDERRVADEVEDAAYSLAEYITNDAGDVALEVARRSSENDAEAAVMADTIQRNIIDRTLRLVAPFAAPKDDDSSPLHACELNPGDFVQWGDGVAVEVLSNKPVDVGRQHLLLRHPEYGDLSAYVRSSDPYRGWQ